jgi:predicted lipoprotein
VGTERSLNRREVLVGAAMVGASGALAACAKRDRAGVLRALSTEVAVELARGMHGSAQRLQAECQALSLEPGLRALLAARAAFRAAALAWKRAAAFRGGPFATSQVFQRAAFWPARPPAIEALLRSTQPIDETLVEGLGVEARGLFALEYLLFGEPSATLVGAEGARARSYALELSVNVLGFATRLRRLLGEGHTLGEELARDGVRSLALLVAETRDSLEIVRGKLLRVEHAVARGTSLDTAVEGFYSQTSVAIAAALVEGVERYYAGGPGGGLADLVARASPEIDQRVRQAYLRVTKAFSALPPALEAAARHPRFVELRSSLEALQHIVHVEMTSALEG